MTTHAGPSIEDIKHAAQARVVDILAALGVREAPSHGGYISMCNPMVKDRHPSFTVWVRGPAAGAFKDHRDDGPGGTRGDVIDLVSYLSGWWQLPKKGRAQALRWLVDFLGLARVDRAQLEADRAHARKVQAEAEKKRDEDLAAHQSRAFKVWLDAEPSLAGTPAGDYLRQRGIALDALPRGPRGGERTPHIIRSLARCKHIWEERGSPRDGEESFWPTMVAGCVDTAVGMIRAVHRTWLSIAHSDDQVVKAPVVPQKKVWPAFGGLVIPLWRGESGLSVRDAAACGLRETLVLTEGIEDGLTAALAAPNHRVWAFIAIGNLANVRLPACCDGVILHRQNEWENATAVASFERGKAALAAQGRPVVEVEAFAGKDLNDTLRGAA